MKQLIGSDLIILNLVDAEKILNRSLNSYQDMEEAAKILLTLEAKSVLLQGGRIKDALFSQDYWTNGLESFWLAGPRLEVKDCRGKGKILSSAIAACMGLDYPLKDALIIAKMHLNRSVRQGIDRDLGPGNWPEDERDLPYLATKPLTQGPQPFTPCSIGLYPVVDSSSWVEKLLSQGVKWIQLRIKDASSSFLREEIKRSVFLAKKYAATLFINDYWQLALRFGANGIHLGQEDLQGADINAIRQSGLYLGLSTHCYHEVAIAHSLNPSYIACGPIYPTTSKIIAFQPQGVEQFQRWRRTLKYPLVAIGGITLERLPEVLQTGSVGISLISAITKAKDPLWATQALLARIKELS